MGNIELLAGLGKVAGIGGISLGVFLLIVRQVVTRKYPDPTKEHVYRLLQLCILCTFAIAAMGLLAWVYVMTLPVKPFHKDLDVVLPKPVPAPQETPPSHQCYTPLQSVAYCVLTASSTAIESTFTVAGEGDAKGPGDNGGIIRVVMKIDDGQPCNSGANQEFSVDNETRLPGGKTNPSLFRCQVRVPRGSTKKVTVETLVGGSAWANFTRAEVY